MSTFEQTWRRRFEKRALESGAAHVVSGWSEAGLRCRVEAFEALLDDRLLAREPILELGCGAGTYVRLLAKHGRLAVGLDYSVPTLLRAVAADPSGARRYLAGEAYALPFRDASLGGLVCIGVLQALSRLEPAVAEMGRTLAPGGVLVVETLNPLNPLALARRLAVALTLTPPRLSYHAPEAVERALARVGVTPIRRVAIVLPPPSVPRLEGPLARGRVGKALGALPGIGRMIPHAVWIVGEKR